jgi:hypothetical protein
MRARFAVERALLEDAVEARSVIRGNNDVVLARRISSMGRARRPIYFYMFTDGRLGVTASDGIYLSSTASDSDLLASYYHEFTHDFFSTGLTQGFRARLRDAGYSHSSLLRYLEEAIAETYSRVKMQGLTRNAVWGGIKHPLLAATETHPGYYGIRLLPGPSSLGGAPSRFHLGIALEGLGIGGAGYGLYRGANRLAAPLHTPPDPQ